MCSAVDGELHVRPGDLACSALTSSVNVSVGFIDIVKAHTMCVRTWVFA